MSPLERAISVAGGQSELAARLKVTPQAIQQWAARGLAPARRVVQIAAAVDFKVTPHELDPALYPRPGDGMPEGQR